MTGLAACDAVRIDAVRTEILLFGDLLSCRPGNGECSVTAETLWTLGDRLMAAAGTLQSVLNGDPDREDA